MTHQYENTVSQIWGLLHELCSRNFHIHLQWIPSHVGLEGNDLVDALAKRGLTVDSDEPLSFTCAKSCVQKTLSDFFTNAPERDTVYWTTQGSRSCLRRPPTSPPNLRRAGEVLLRQLRVSRHPLLYDFKMPNDTAPCILCSSPCTIKHLLSCPVAVACARHRFDTSWRTTLYDDQLDVLAFLVLAGYVDQPIHHYVRFDD